MGAREPVTAEAVAFELDGQPVQARAGETIWQAARRLGLTLPHLCHTDGLRPEGNCRACVVEVEGERTLAASCCRTVTPGLKVRTASERAVASRRLVLELLLTERPVAGDPDSAGEGSGRAAGDAAGRSGQPVAWGELGHWARQVGVDVRQALRSPTGQARPQAPDDSHPAIRFDADACIQCTRCVRACREEQVHGVIGYAGRGAAAHIVFDLGDPMGASRCVACGECVQACPTGALSARPFLQVGAQPVPAASEATESAMQAVPSVCPFCGVGCQLSYQVQGGRITGVLGRDGPANQGRLCVKGRFGFDYIHHPQRLTRPLVRREDAPKRVEDCTRDASDWRAVFREASWEEALDRAAHGLLALKARHGPAALAGFGSAKGTNEEAYLFQKLVRTGFGTHNVDHCTRLCHASSVAALLEGVGSGAVSNPVGDVAQADFILVIGANPEANHPVAASWIKNAVQRGARLVVADPRRTPLADHAWRTLAFRPDTDVALLNALIHVILFEGLAHEAFLRERASGVEALREAVRACTPEAMAPICGIAAATLREVARAYASASAAMILWGMGISQHVHGTDNARCLIALCAVAGQIGRPGTGLHPLRGQNNVQGASDAGLIPMMLPNYQRVADPAARAAFERLWGVPLPAEPGLTVVEILNQALAGDADPRKVRGMYIVGENPAMSDPDLAHARAALAVLSHLVVQDIFLTETAWLADVVLPATAWPEKTGTVTNTDRLVQLGRQAVPPPGDARGDLWCIRQMAQRFGLDWRYGGPHDGVADVFEEMRQAMVGAIGGITWERLERDGAVQYPCLSADDPGQRVVFTERFPTEDGRLHLMPASFAPGAEPPDADWPLVLITGRVLEHWHTGSMTRRAGVLDALEPAPFATLHPAEMARLGLHDGQPVEVASRRGAVQVALRADSGTPEGAVFMPFAFREAAANLLTNAALDPFGKIPEFKFCAVRVRAA